MNNLLKTTFLNRDFPSPLVLPAGIMGVSASSMEYISRSGCGAVTTKSLSLSPRKGHPGPVTEPVTGGLLNAMGLCNPGIKEGLEEAIAYKGDAGLIISLFATNAKEFAELAKQTDESAKTDKMQKALIELNLSCPNVLDEFGTPLAASSVEVTRIIKAVKASTTLPVIAKLSPNVTDIIPIAKAAEEAGADALCLINTLGPGLAIDIETVKPILSNKYGGLSGACVKPIALRLVHLVSQAVSIPIIGMGGVTTWEDAVEMIMAGADMVGIGTAVMDEGMEIYQKVNAGMVEYMEAKKITSINNIPRLEN